MHKFSIIAILLVVSAVNGVDWGWQSNKPDQLNYDAASGSMVLGQGQRTWGDRAMQDGDSYQFSIGNHDGSWLCFGIIWESDVAKAGDLGYSSKPTSVVCTDNTDYGRCTNVNKVLRAHENDGVTWTLTWKGDHLEGTTSTGAVYTCNVEPSEHQQVRPYIDSAMNNMQVEGVTSGVSASEEAAAADDGEQCDESVKDDPNVVFCSECNWTGKKNVVEDEDNCLEFSPKSIHVPKGKQVKVYEVCEFGGKDAVITQDTECIDTIPFNNLHANGITLHGKKHKNLKTNSKQNPVKFTVMDSHRHRDMDSHRHRD